MLGGSAGSLCSFSVPPAAAALVASCGGGSATSPTSPSPGAPSATHTAGLSGRLSLFGYEDGFVPQAIGGFEKANPGLKVSTASFGTNDEAVAKMRAGFRVDVVDVCVEETPRMVKLGLLQPLDTSRIVGWSDIVPSPADHSRRGHRRQDLHGARQGRDGRHPLQSQRGAPGASLRGKRCSKTPPSKGGSRWRTPPPR